MPTIFNLNNIHKLIDDVKPSAAIIIDTNIIVSEPDFTLWKTTLDNPLFILPCMIKLELENMKNQPELKPNAMVATKNIMDLCHEGHIREGIYKESRGWFINVELPNQQALESELEKLDTLVRAFGQADTKLIILAKELMRTEKSMPVIFATADEKLFNAIKFIGINAYLFRGFPMAGIEGTGSKSDLLLLNWDKVLEDIQQEAGKKLISVELSLLSKNCDIGRISLSLDAPAGKNQTIIAGGSGILHASQDIHFTWILPFLAWDFPSLQITTLESSANTDQVKAGKPDQKTLLGTVSLEFEDQATDIAPWIHKALINKINNCASPLAYIEDMPTLQDPVAVMKQFFLFEMVFQDGGFSGELPVESLSEFENKMRNSNSLLTWAFYWLRERKANAEDLNLSLNEFLNAMKSCWSIGDTITFNLMADTFEMTAE